MYPILHIASKDLMQMMRDRKTFMFLLLMPVAFTLLFGYAFRGAGPANPEERLAVGFLNQDSASSLSLELERSLQASTLIQLDPWADQAELEKAVGEQELAAALIIPPGYGHALQTGSPLALIVLADTNASTGLSALTEIRTVAERFSGAALTARVIAPHGGEMYAAALEKALNAWQNPPVRLSVVQNSVVPAEPQAAGNPMANFAHSSPAMILQFAIAGLLTCAQVIVAERKSRCLQRLLTTATSRVQVLLGHYLAIFSLILLQFAVLILFGQVILNLDYFSQPLATLLIAVTAALCISALGLLIGVLAKGEDQAITFSLICMFLLAGLGGAWVPLEFTGATFQVAGHLSPLAWAMDGFKNVLIRGLDVRAALLPAAALLGYAALFLGLAGWRFKRE